MDQLPVSYRQKKTGVSLKYGKALVPLGVLLGSLAVYCLTLSPTINSFDSAELITGAYTLGIIHAPGYPLYLMLGHFAAMMPWGTVPSNVNFLSALFSAFAATITFFSCRRVSGITWSSLLATTCVAFSAIFWSQAVVAEVYALNALLLSGVIYLDIRFIQQPSALTLTALAFVLGLSMTNHPSTILLVPGMIISLWMGRQSIELSWSFLLAATGAFVLPLLLYLYLPLRFMAKPDLNYVAEYFTADLSSVRGLFWMVSGQMFAQEVFGRSLREGLLEAGTLVRVIWLNFLGAGFFLAIWGLSRLRDQKRVLIFLATGIVLNLLFFAFYDVIDNQQMIVPILILLAPALSHGISQLWADILGDKSMTPVAQFIRAAVMACVMVLLLAINWSAADRSNDWSTYVLASEILDEVEEDALILTQWTIATPLHYLQLVEGQKPDVRIFDRGLLALGIRDTLTRTGDISNKELNARINEQLKTMVEDTFSGREVYITEDDPLLRSLFCYDNVGQSLYRITAVGHDCLNNTPE